LRNQLNRKERGKKLDGEGFRYSCSVRKKEEILQILISMSEFR
jgi:hypothetical protein